MAEPVTCRWCGKLFVEPTFMAGRGAVVQHEIREHRIEMLNMGGGILRAFCSCGKLALFTDAKVAFDVMNAHQHEEEAG